MENQELLKIALKTAELAQANILKYYQADVGVEWKADNTPVTIADKSTEELLREFWLKETPDFGVLGEEFGDGLSDKEYRWIVDPIDGTKSFIRGVPLFGTLIALYRKNVPVASVIRIPALHSAVWAVQDGGAFLDAGGAGTGGIPEGLTIIDGQLLEDAYYDEKAFAGFDAQGILHVGYFTYEDCVNMGIVGGVSFLPPLIINGIPQDTSWMVSGVNPRTAIGQRADGAVLMLAINGRQLSSMGATYADLVEIMMEFGAVNAMNLDGGSSTVMYLNGELVNTPSSESGYSRGLPNAILFR